MFLLDNKLLVDKHHRFHWNFDWVLVYSHLTHRKILHHNLQIRYLEMIQLLLLDRIYQLHKVGTHLYEPDSAKRKQQTTTVTHNIISRWPRWLLLPILPWRDTSATKAYLRVVRSSRAFWYWFPSSIGTVMTSRTRNGSLAVSFMSFAVEACWTL